MGKEIFAWPSLPFCSSISFTRVSSHEKVRGKSRSSPLGMQHFDQKVVTGHLPAQVLVVEVLLSLHAERPDVSQPEKQLPEFVRGVRIVADGVLQQCCVGFLLGIFC